MNKPLRLFSGLSVLILTLLTCIALPSFSPVQATSLPYCDPNYDANNIKVTDYKIPTSPAITYRGRAFPGIFPVTTPPASSTTAPTDPLAISGPSEIIDFQWNKVPGLTTGHQYQISIDELAYKNTAPRAITVALLPSTQNTYRYTLREGYRYNWWIQVRDPSGCFGRVWGGVIYTTRDVNTVLMGRVVTGTTPFSTTPSICGAGYPSSTGLAIKSERFNTSGGIDATGIMNLDNCNTGGPFYSSGIAPSAKRRLTVQNMPAGYTCSDWSYAMFNKVTNAWEDKKVSSGAIFDKTACSVTVTTNTVTDPYDNSHHIWFYITKIVPTPTSTPIPTNTPIPTSTPIQPTIVVTIAPTITKPPISCNIVPTDIELVIDRSSSMWKTSVTSPQGVKKTKLEWAKDAANKFVDQFASTGAASKGIVRIGVTSFVGNMTNTKTTSFTPVTNFAQVHTWINAIPANQDGSCLSCGISAAQTSLTNAGLNAGKATRKVVVFLSDGRANHMITKVDLNKDGVINETDAGYEAINLANAARSSSKYLFYVVGFGSSTSVRTWVLKGDHSITSPFPDTGIANEPASTYYRYDQDAFDWTTLFNQTQDNICRNPSLLAK